MARDLPSAEERTIGTVEAMPVQAGEKSAVPPRTGWTRHRFIHVVVIPWAFMLPILLLHALVVLVPAVQGVYYSFTEWSGIGEAKFVGLENFRRIIFEDDAYANALRNNLIWMAFFATVPFALALFTSSLLSRVKFGGIVYRMLLFMPFVIPSVVVASIWRYLLSPRFGIGAQLARLGIHGLNVAFLGRPDTALLAIAFADNWHFWGFLMVLFLTAMQAIPTDLYDAAKVDGANRWQEFRHVTLPGIRPTVLFMLMMSMIWSFLVFEYVWLLTQGGPGRASEVLGVVIFKNAFRTFDAGYAAAEGMTISVIAGLIVLLFIFLRKRGWEI
jgi:raffinose/stachyose/melibiose transport system permease protein